MDDIVFAGDRVLALLGWITIPCDRVTSSSTDVTISLQLDDYRLRTNINMTFYVDA